MCAEVMPERAPAEEIAELRGQVAALAAQVKSLRAKQLPETNILSPNFWTRSWAIFGHVSVPQVILWVTLYILAFAAAGLTLVSQ
jgi:hypothetical protein